MANELELTDDEKRAIKALKRVAKSWPNTLWLFAGGQQDLAVMRVDARGEKAKRPDDSIDPAYMVDQITGLNADGGDW